MKCNSAIAAALDDFFLFTSAQGLATQRYKIAISGGVDSMVLAHACKQWVRRGIGTICLSAVHVNHQLGNQSPAMEAVARHFCTQLDIPFVAVSLQIAKRPRHSLEAIARRLRYEALIGNERCVALLAHNLGDQAETYLLNSLRGSDVNALAAMQVIRKHKDGWIGRPLLGVHRDVIEAYAREHGIRWIEDSSNQDRGLRRNYLRHEIIPLLRDQFPAAEAMLARSASRCAQSHMVIEHSAASWWQQQGMGNILRLHQWRQLHASLQVAIVRIWAQVLPRKRQLAELLAGLRQPGARATLQWLDGEHTQVCKIWHDHAFLYRSGDLQKSPIDYQLASDLSLESGACHPYLCRSGRRRSIKSLLKQEGILPWWRPQLEIVCKAGVPIMLGDIALAQGAVDVSFRVLHRLRLPITNA